MHEGMLSFPILHQKEAMISILDTLVLFGVIVLIFALYALTAIVCIYSMELYLSRPISPIQDEMTVPPSNLKECSASALKFKKVRENAEEGTIQTGCVVCLSSFEDEEYGQQLPGCRHCYRCLCINTWLHYRSNCPICRKPVEPLDSQSLAFAAGYNSMEDQFVSIGISS